MKVYQLLDALDIGDAVSNHSIEIRDMIIELGYLTNIYTIHYNEKVSSYRDSIENLKVTNQDVILYHFSGKSNLIDKIKRLKCKKVLVYHNITPHHFFTGMEPHFTHCLEGRNQLKELSGLFDLYLGDSEFNVEELVKLNCSPTKVMPIIINNEIKGESRVYKNIKNEKKFLFVGRVAPNKKHEDIMRIFDYYCSYINNNSKLYFIGNYQDYSIYYEQLNHLKSTMLSSSNIFFTGKISQEELDFHYRSADIFIAMSEHEGFCVPILESMTYGLTTMAYESGAITSTMGNAGIMITEKKFEDIAELIDILLNDEQLMNEIILKQYKWLENFAYENSKDILSNILKGLESSEVLS